MGIMCTHHVGIGLTDLPKTGGGGGQLPPLFRHPCIIMNYLHMYYTSRLLVLDEFNRKFLSHADSENVLHGQARPTNFLAKT